MNMKRKLSQSHLLIIVVWLLPYIPLFEIQQFVMPFFATVIFIIIDVVKSNERKDFNQYILRVIGTNIVGMIITTLEYEFSNYAFGQNPNFGPGMGFVFAGIWDIMYCVLLAIVIFVGYFAIRIKQRF